MMDNEHAGRQLMQRNRARAERMLKLLRENSSEVTTVHGAGSGFCYHSQQILDGLGEALENNTQVTELSFFLSPGQRLKEGNMEKILRFVEKSESLNTLCCRDLPKNYTRQLLVSLSKRRKGLDDLRVRVRSRDLGHFQSFLRDTPMIKELSVTFDEDPAAIDPKLSVALLASAATAKIEHIHLDTAEWPCDFLTAFKGNPNLKNVSLLFDYTRSNYRRKLASLRSCKNAHYSVSLRFTSIDWDRGLWNVLVNELQDHNVIKELSFDELGFPEFFVEILPKLFEGTGRKLEFGYFYDAPADEILDAIVASTSHFVPGYCFYSDGSFANFLCALTKPTAVMESLHLRIINIEDADTFVEFAPRFRSLKSLSLELEGDFDELYDSDEKYDEIRACLQRVKNALWKNRSLTEKIEFTEHDCVHDTDVAFLERILQRNRSLPELLDPRHLISVTPALIPFLFQRSGETDPNELYHAIGSSVLLTFPRKQTP